MDQKSKNSTAVAAGVAGAVVGAGAAVIATKVMTDKNLRDKVTGTITQVKDQVLEVVDHAQIANQKGGTASLQVKGSKTTEKSGSASSGSQSGKTGTSQASNSTK